MTVADSGERMHEAVERSNDNARKVSDELRRVNAAIDACDGIPLRELDDEDSLITSVAEVQIKSERSRRALAGAKR